MSDSARRVFSRRAAFYATSAAHKDQVVLARLVELARPEPNARALDVATGTGHTAFALAPHLAQVVATDLTEEMLAEGRKLGAGLGLKNVEFRLADAHELPFPEAAFELVTCRRAAHHFTDLGRALREMARVLKPDGRWVIDDRSVPDDDFVDPTMNRLDRLHDPSHVRQYRAGEWERMLDDAGLEADTVEPYAKLRPLSSLTDGADSRDVAEIRALVAGFTEAQRASLNVVEKDGEIHTSHWYLMIAGTKRTR